MKIILRYFEEKADKDEKGKKRKPSLDWFGVLPSTSSGGVAIAVKPDGTEFKIKYEDYAKTKKLSSANSFDYSDIPSNRKIQEFFKLFKPPVIEYFMFSATEQDYFKRREIRKPRELKVARDWKRV